VTCWQRGNGNRLQAARVTLAAGVAMLVLCAGIRPAAAGRLERRGQTLTWDGEPIHLVGYSYYGLLGDRHFDAQNFLRILAAHNVNFTRFFLILPWPVEPGPNVLPFARHGGKYDLEKFDDAFFARLRRIVLCADELGIVCQVCLFDRCGLSVADQRAWPNNPYNGQANVNGLLPGGPGGYPPFCRTQGPIAEINAALIAKVVETIGDRGNVIYEIINEPYGQLGPLPQWHAWAAGRLREHLAGRPGSKVISSNYFHDLQEVDVFSMHSAGDSRRVADAVGQARSMNKPLILSDDGDMRCMFNPDVTRAAAERALELGQHFEHLEYAIALQREHEQRPADHFDQLPGFCRLNLRTLSQRSTPLGQRPYLRDVSLRRSDRGPVLRAKLQRGEKARRIIGQRSEDGGRSWLPLGVTVEAGRVRSAPLPLGTGALTLARFVCVDERSRSWPGPACRYGPAGQWWAELGDTIVEAGLMRVRQGIPDGTLRKSRRADRTCYETDLQGRGKYAYFRLDDTFPRGETPRTVSVSIEYHDGPALARLVLEYDAVEGAYTVAAPLSLAGSGEWKSATFTLPRATFRGRQNDGADFRFSLRGDSSPLALRSVRVERAAGS